MATTTTAVYTVDGMSCGHCVNSITQEVGTVAGVTDVQVDLGTKKVTVTGEGTVDDAAVRAAIDEAGYEVRD
ncbi:heavy-metal-associated domain-containing protein [Nocardiopsis changdeensis]|uniref:Heavy-metal-associated domain-containing protein n=1 Tax=Nocardiopsis changdeensis TaxID=2831969 RepID=A0ABX8BM42_9ACTN|nr:MULTISPECIES: heavy metal-associated domain-containing protein [Nocardiopsis]QUX22379.1 heavy-metal-associated domain-containing protein [Nocardiopsis changdeensis]QYX38321.1 heavy-metal-associated domain-containing protein [Nocardiopsis sp. MT53]